MTFLSFENGQTHPCCFPVKQRIEHFPTAYGGVWLWEYGRQQKTNGGHSRYEANKKPFGEGWGDIRALAAVRFSKPRYSAQ
ncbi:MAG: hypothetical protein K0Q90_2393 [Paenibacillaceae bacterium]|jgi:hypothetical protein|nr:hypothetical protein [Paenibacillaceae bacterium]